MLNRDRLFDAVGDIPDGMIASAGNLLGYDATVFSKEADSMQLKQTDYTRRSALRKTGRIFLIAAVLACLLTVTAYATGLFTFSARIPDAEETFRISWEENQSGYIEWSDAKLVLTFPETPVSQEVEFKLNWLPFEMLDNMAGADPWENVSMDTWFTRFASESLFWPENRKNLPEEFQGPEYDRMGQPVLIETYAASMFNDGGAMLMLYQTPGEVHEEHWGDLDVLRFTATQHFDPVPEYDIPELSYVFNFILLSNPEEGWIVEVCGQLDMDSLVKVAKSLEFRTTGRELTHEDFRNKYTFIDVGQG